MILSWLFIPVFFPQCARKAKGWQILCSCELLLLAASFCKLQSWLKCTKKMWRQFSTLRLPLPAQNLLLIIKNNFFIIFIWSANYVGSCKLVQIFIDLVVSIQFLLISQTIDCYWHAQYREPSNFFTILSSQTNYELIWNQWIGEKNMQKRWGSNSRHCDWDHEIRSFVLNQNKFRSGKKENRPTWGSNPRPWD